MLVSPACAGIDRDEIAPCHYGHGFPRVRGDRPGAPAFYVARFRFPPRARG